MKRFKRLFTTLLYILVIALILAVFIIKYFSNKIKPTFNKYAESEIKRIITLIINDTISNDLNDMDANSFFIINSNNTINSFDLNNNKINRLQKKINKHIEDNIRLVSSGKINKIDKYFNSMSDIDYETIKGGIVYYIATGNIAGSIFTNNLGPKIPIKFSMSGNTISNISSSVREYGINNALIEIRINIRVNMIIYMPYVTREITIKSSMPIVTRIIQGSIPKYYIDDSYR